MDKKGEDAKVKGHSNNINFCSLTPHLHIKPIGILTILLYFFFGGPLRRFTLKKIKLACSIFEFSIRNLVLIKSKFTSAIRLVYISHSLYEVFFFKYLKSRHVWPTLFTVMALKTGKIDLIFIFISY